MSRLLPTPTRSLLVLGGALILALAILARPVEAVVVVTPASGGTSISADTAGAGGSGAWTSLGSISIAEGANDDFAISQAGVTVVLTAPSGFEFNTGQVPDVTGASSDLSALSMSVPSSTTLQLTFTTDGVADALDTIVIGGVTAIQVRPTAGSPLATGNIIRASGTPGTASVVGVTNDVTNFGTLTEVAGAVSQLGITTEPASATAGAAFGQQPVVRSEDQFGNASTSGLGASLNVTASINAGSGPLQGTTALDIGTGAGNGSVTYTDLRLDVAQAGVTLDFAATGLTTATSAGFAVGHGAATQLALTTSPSASSASGAAFAQQPVVTIRDAFGNTATSDNTTVVTASLTTGTGTLSGTTTKTAASGIADFAGNNLSIDLAGTDKVLTFSAGGLTSAVSGAFTITSSVPDASTSTITASPSSITADGSEVSTITVQLKDAGSTNLSGGGDTVVLSTTIGSLSAVTDNGDGTYTATLTSGTTGTAVVSGTVNAAAITDTASVTLTARSVPPPPPTTNEPGVEVTLVDVTTDTASDDADTSISASSSDGSAATVSVPAGALPTGSSFSVGAVADPAELATQASPPAGVSVLLGFSITATDAVGDPVTTGFGAPVELAFTLDAGSVPAAAGDGTLRIAFWNGVRWVALDTTVTVNADGSVTLSGATDHFSLYSVVYDPAGVARFHGEVPTSGVGLVSFGGSIAELEAAMAAAGCVATPAFVSEGGAWVSYLPGAPFAAINAEFEALFAEGIPLGRAFFLSNCN